MQKQIRTALISVYYKDNGLDNIIHELNRLGVTLYSTGGTQSFIEGLGVAVKPVESLTSYPSILGGRVKTLHPKIFGGILARSANEQDKKELAEYGIPTFDLVIVDLYPFEETVSNTADEQAIIEKIDIGGVSLIRAAAKNFTDTYIVSSRTDYAGFMQLLREKGGITSLSDRRAAAARAFMNTSHYDTRIFEWFNRDGALKVFKQSELNGRSLRYGENPHQQGFFFGRLDEVFEVLNGKELSYNNLVDVDSAINLVAEFGDPAVAIIKHTNSCGLAMHNDIASAYQAALACDPTSAFGGVIAANKRVKADAAKLMNELFFEILVAPDFDEDALQLLKSKKNRILLRLKNEDWQPRRHRQFRSLLGGVLAQDSDSVAESLDQFKVVTKRPPTDYENFNLEFAIKAVKHLKSNGIAIVKNFQLIGMGCGQTSRVDALNQALAKAKQFGFDTEGAVMASDAFFPFPDCVSIAANAGVTAIAQPGGSIKDQDSVQMADAYNLAMVMTGVRHFKH